MINMEIGTSDFVDTIKLSLVVVHSITGYTKGCSNENHFHQPLRQSAMGNAIGV